MDSLWPFSATWLIKNILPKCEQSRIAPAGRLTKFLPEDVVQGDVLVLNVGAEAGNKENADAVVDGRREPIAA
jgi:hypothetical protein